LAADLEAEDAADRRPVDVPVLHVGPDVTAVEPVVVAAERELAAVAETGSICSNTGRTA